MYSERPVRTVFDTSSVSLDLPAVVISAANIGDNENKHHRSKHGYERGYIGHAASIIREQTVTHSFHNNSSKTISHKDDWQLLKAHQHMQI